MYITHRKKWVIWLRLMSHWFVRITKHLKDHVSHHDSFVMSHDDSHGPQDSLQVSLHDSLKWVFMTHLSESWRLRLICDESWWLTWSFKCFVIRTNQWLITNESDYCKTHFKWVFKTHLNLQDSHLTRSESWRLILICDESWWLT